MVAVARDAAPVDRLICVSAPQSYANPARNALRLVGLAVVLMGLFGMHGLANHGVGGMENMSPVMAQTSGETVGATVDLVSVGLADVAAPLTEHLLGSTSRTSGQDGHQGMDMNIAGLCVATLAVGLFALLLLLRTGHAPRAPWFLAGRGFALKPAGRDPDPPSLTALSRQRC